MCRIWWGCLTYWNSETNPVDECALCYPWAVRCYEAKFGKTFHNSRLRSLERLGLLIREKASVVARAGIIESKPRPSGANS